MTTPRRSEVTGAVLVTLDAEPVRVTGRAAECVRTVLAFARDMEDIAYGAIEVKFDPHGVIGVTLKPSFQLRAPKRGPRSR